jgi:hypothetical protein
MGSLRLNLRVLSLLLDRGREGTRDEASKTDRQDLHGDVVVWRVLVIKVIYSGGSGCE